MISTKGRYALRVMIELAGHEQGQYVPLKDIAQKQGISKKYLEIIVKELVAAHLLKGVSGKGGGYTLSKSAEEYTLDEILEATEVTLAVVACLSEDAEACPREEKCETLPLWEEYNALVHDFFHSKKLSDLL